MRYLIQLSVQLVVLLAIAACTGGGVPPVSDRSRATNTTARATDYRVVKGDTLYSIAWRHQRDFRELAALNRIRPPYDIYPGQRLQVQGNTPRARLPAASKPASVKPKVAARAPAARTKPHPLASTQTKPQTGSATQSAATSKPAPQPALPKPAAQRVALPKTGPVKLRWPGQGKRLIGFGQARTGSPLPSNSIDFELAPGASIRAAAAGEVVYVGQALAGFEQFVIVKHNDTWLSAYGFNAPANVREKQRLASGAVLAVIGRGAYDRERRLHFEVRKNGLPVNPAGVIK